MPQTEGAMSLSAEDEVELVKAAAKLSRNKGSFKAKLTRQTPVEMSEKRQVLKQESKDSGIVTEMFVRPKENKHSSDNLKEYARQESKSEKKKSLAKRSQSMKIKRTQSCKVKGEREREYLERTHDDSEIELLTPKQNGSIDDDTDKKNPSTIRGMWKKAFKNLKSSASEPKLTKKSSLIKKKQNSKEGDDEVEPEPSGPLDPVYSLLKCAADLPKGGGGKSPCLVHPHCSGHHQSPSYQRYPSGGDSSGNTSKTSSPSSSEFQDIVTDGLGSGFKQYYKITSPAKKTSSVFDAALT